ncbi:MAG: VIT family protein [Acidobacteria bacterium]|nr:VIT family protein [Acidobacteriota bacterium]
MLEASRSAMVHVERHRSAHVGWLRAAVLGANDGLISTSSLVVGVAAATIEGREPVLLAATAGLVAGALSMAAGEYVSVSSQADTESADFERERRELEDDPLLEHEELADIYRARGLSAQLATQVASELMAHDALAAHARDELGITDSSRARPLQAAFTSAAAFALGAALPVVVAAVVPVEGISAVVGLSTIVLLAVLGGLAARLGGAPIARGAARVTFWGAVAMIATALVGRLFGAAF